MKSYKDSVLDVATNLSVLWLIILFGVIIAIALYALTENQRWRWTVVEANERLGIAVPADANDVQIEGRRDGVGRFRLSFTAPPDVMSAYVSHFCDGIYFSGYDPFNAINSPVQVENAHEFRLDAALYYSYSPDVLETIWGNRCREDDGSVLLIRIDRTDSALHSLVLEPYWSCEPCYPHDENNQPVYRSNTDWHVPLNIVTVTPR